MKKYKFLIRKVKEMEIEVCAKNHKQAMIDLLLEVVKKDEDYLKDDNNYKKDLFIKVKKIINEKGKENPKDYEDFIRENRFLISKFEEDFLEENDKNSDENEENSLEEYDEIICEKCGNFIRMDKDLLS